MIFHYFFSSTHTKTTYKKYFSLSVTIPVAFPAPSRSFLPCKISYILVLVFVFVFFLLFYAIIKLQTRSRFIQFTISIKNLEICKKKTQSREDKKDWSWTKFYTASIRLLYKAAYTYRERRCGRWQNAAKKKYKT